MAARTQKMVTPKVQVENLRLSYGPKEVIHGISFDIEPNEILGIIGCAGPWETYDTNVATGYPGSAAGFFDGWYALGLGNAENFL